jgi:hypothetical protein
MMLAICSNVWNVANTAIFDTFSGDFTKKKSKTVENPHEIQYFLAFFVLWRREA